MNSEDEIIKVKNLIKKRQEQKIDRALPIIIKSNPLEIGLYGSTSRGQLKATSDVDIYALYQDDIPRTIKGELYEEMNDIGIDLLISQYELFNNSDSVFCKNVIRDRIILWRKGDCYAKRE